MALSSLNQLTYDQYRALTITPFSATPTRTTTGTPDSRVSIQLIGFVGTDVLVFTNTDQPSIDVNTSYKDASRNILGITVSPGSSPNAMTTYWTVNMGAGASGTDWSITYSVADGGTTTGSWTFTKGRPTEPFKG